MSQRLVVGLLVLAAVVAGLAYFVKSSKEPAFSLADLAHGQMAKFEIVDSSAPTPQIPQTPFYNEAGETLTLDDFRGKVVLVNLWATWCAPCLKEMPTLDRLQAELGSKYFEVLAISVDKAGVETSRAFLERTGAQHLSLYVEPKFRINRELSVYGLPATILFDDRGKELGRITGPAEWDSKDAKRLIEFVVEPLRADD